MTYLINVSLAGVCWQVHWAVLVTSADWLWALSINTHTHVQGRCSLTALSSSEQVRVWAQTCPASRVGQANQTYRCVPLCVCLCTSCSGCNGRCDTLPRLFIEFTAQIQTNLHQTITGSDILWTGWIEMGLSCLLHDWKTEDRTDIGVQRDGASS